MAIGPKPPRPSSTLPSQHFGARPNLIETGDIADVDECTLLLLLRRPLPKAERFEVESADPGPGKPGLSAVRYRYRY